MKSKKIIKLFISVLVIGTLSMGTWAFAEVVINKEQSKESFTKVNQVSSIVKEGIGSGAVVNSGDMTIEELRSFNGQNGQPAYIAVDGTIYDVTKLGSWSNGTHSGYSAGADLTDAFSKSPHAKSILSAATVVGTLVKDPTIAVVAGATIQAESNVNISPTQSEVKTPDIVIKDNTIPSGIWTLEKLAAYNGKNGQPAYIAVGGTIYDVTKLGSWSNGTHNGYSAGVDLTDAFSKSPHAMSILNNAVVIGTIGQTVATQTPIVVDQAIISQHDDDYDDDHDDDHDDDYDDDHDDDHDDEHDDDHDDHDDDHDDERDDD